MFLHALEKEGFLTAAAAIAEVLKHAPELSCSYLQWFQECETLEEFAEIYENNRIYDHVRIYETADGFVFEYMTRDISESLCLMVRGHSIKASIEVLTEEESWFSTVVRAFKEEGWKLIPDSEEGPSNDVDVLMGMSGLQFENDAEKAQLLHMMQAAGYRF